MLHHFRRNLKHVARGLIALVAALWLMAGASPCVMAQPHTMDAPVPHHAMPAGMADADMHDCGPVTAVDCKLKDLVSPLSSVPADLAVTPVLLTILPAPIALAYSAPVHTREFFTPDIPAPPLHIRHLVLLI